ncbi:hypothetical protein ACHAO4_000748 [Trichoderma viride]
MSDQQQTAKVIKAEPSEESSEEPRTSRTGVASIALVATRMLRDMLYSREQMTARDTQEMEHFLNYVGDERDIRRYTEGLHLIGQNNNETSDTRFRDIFKGDRTSTS